MTRTFASLRAWTDTHRDLAFPLAVALAMRVGLSLFAAFVVASSPVPIEPRTPGLYHGVAPIEPAGLNLLIAPFQRWDAIWYQLIAERGYAATDLSTAFFPLFSILTRVVMVVAPNGALAGLIVSTLATTLAFVVFYRVTKRAFGEGTARRALIAWSLFPTAYYLFAPYAESVFVLCALLSLEAAHERHWWRAGIFGGLAAAARSPGVLLVIPLGVEWVLWSLTPKANGFRSATPEPATKNVTLSAAKSLCHADEIPWTAQPRNPHSGFGRLRSAQNDTQQEISISSLAMRVLTSGRAGLPLLLVPAGMVAYMLYLQLAFGDAFLWQKALAAWQWTPTAPWDTVARTINAMLFGDVGARANNFVDLSATLFVLALVVAGMVGKLKSVPLIYTLYALVFLIGPLTTTAHAENFALVPMYAAARRAVVIFPAFMPLGALLNDRWRAPIYFAVSLALQLILLFVFVHWMWVD